MREIRFRGYNKRTGWVYGLYCGYGQIKMDGGMIVAVDPRTIGQSTGLKDKTGFLIFDGDILDLGDRLAVVEWNTPNGTWDCIFMKYTTPIPQSNGAAPVEWKYRAQIVNNIYDEVKHD